MSLGLLSLVQGVFQGIDLETIFGRYLDGYELEDFPRRGEGYTFRADEVTWGVSEVRGINRSFACLDESGRPVRSNAALLAAMVNKVVGLVREKHPEVRFWLWDDMLNPFNNGGDVAYQEKYGGVPGRSACAVAPASIESLCGDEIANVPEPIVAVSRQWNEGIIMQPWSYWPTRLRRMTATLAWYREHAGEWD